MKHLLYRNRAEYFGKKYMYELFKRERNIFDISVTKITKTGIVKRELEDIGFSENVALNFIKILHETCTDPLLLNELYEEYWSR